MDNIRVPVAAGEALLRAVFDGALDAMVLMDDEGRYIDANPAASVLFGAPRDELIGQRTIDLVRLEAPRSADAARRELLKAGHLEGVVDLVRRDGTRRSVEYRATANVVPGLHMSILRDVTARCAAENERREQQNLLEAAQAAAHIGCWVASFDGDETVRWSREAYRIFGVPEGTPVTKASFLALVHPEDRAHVESAIGGSLVSGASFDLEHRILCGDEVRWVRGRGGVERDEGGRPLRGIGTVQDITEEHARRQEQRAYEAERHRLAAIVEGSLDAIIGVTVDGIITSWNGAAERLYQYSAAEAIGRPLTLLIPEGTHGEEAEVLARIVAGERVANYETQRRRKDGRLVDVAVTMSPIRDGNGRVVGASKVARDLTDRKLAEQALLRSEEQLRHAQKMEAIGSLAGGVAHDFNNLLSVVLSYTSMLQDRPSLPDSFAEDLAEIQKAAARATELTQHLLAFSRKQVLEPHVLNLNQSVDRVRRMLDRVLGEDIELTVSASPRLGNVFADPGQIEQVIMNLAVNARDAMPGGGHLTIETSNVVLDDAYANEHHGVQPGAYVMLAVSDSGVGMTASVRERIFEPFFTTKAVGRGTGLGLSTVFGIVTQSGGHIWVYSEPGKGSTFKVYLPRTDRSETASVEEGAPIAVLTGSETVLLVEDQEQVRKMMNKVLRSAGYQVLVAANGGDALLFAEQYAPPIHLLVTDVVMPRMTGRQLAERLAPLRPAMRVLYVSGYTENSIVHHGILDPGIAFLSKPLTPQLLLRKVREVLDGPAHGG